MPQRLWAVNSSHSSAAQDVADGVDDEVNLVAFAQRVEGGEGDAYLGPQAGDDQLATSGRGDRIAELVRTAPNETLALRYQDGLIEFERALAVLREEAEKEDPEVVKRREWMAAATGTTVEAPKEEEAAPITPPITEKAEPAAAPDAVLCSRARRTQMTADAVGKALRMPEPQFVHAIYGATPGELLALIETHAPDAHQVLLVGHNPGMEELLALMTEGRSAGARGMSPATVAWIDLTDDALEPGHGRLQALWSP